MEIANLSEHCSRNFFSPPNRSFNLADKFGMQVNSARILPISPTGSGPLECRISMVTVKRALADTTFSKIKLPYSIFFHRAVADTIAGSLVNLLAG